MILQGLTSDGVFGRMKNLVEVLLLLILLTKRSLTFRLFLLVLQNIGHVGLW